MGGPCVRRGVPLSGPRPPAECGGAAPRGPPRTYGAHDGAHDHGRTRADRDRLRDDGGRRTSPLQGRCKGICSGEESRVPGRPGHRPSVAFVVRVMATGVFDLLHPGHLYFLREARKLGDELWVVVARDRTARRFKHEPITPEDSRLQLVEALKPVDRAVLGHEGDIYDILDEIRILEECRKRGLSTKVVRLPKFEGDLDGTRKIVRKVAEWLALQERLSEVERGKVEVPADPPARRRKRKA